MERIVAELVGVDADGGADAAEQAYAFVRGADHVRALRVTHRIYGAAEGGGTAEPAQTLRLSLEELAVGLAHDFLALNEPPSDVTSSESVKRLASGLVRSARGEERGPTSVLAQAQRDRILVFHNLWERGYFVTTGSKFGADFLIYAGDPARTHAVALVVVKALDAPFARVDLVSLGRVAKMVKKQLYLASVRPNEAGHRDDVVFVLLTHALLATQQEEEDAGEGEEERA